MKTILFSCLYPALSLKTCAAPTTGPWKDWLVSRELVSTTDDRDLFLIERCYLDLAYRGNGMGGLPR